jgi:multicomponent Na+:H+ antiporter subunit C
LSLLPYLVFAWLFVVGLYGMVTSRNLIHLIVCLSVTESSTFLFLIMLAYRRGAGAPIFTHGYGPPAADPVLHALTLVDIVVGTVVTALLLSVAVDIHKRTGTLDPAGLSGAKNPG